jgi:NitT/TauT family transport system ATP-binding protein
MTERVVAAFVPLVDCAVLVAAREHGFAAAAGIDLTLVKEPSWASLRDHLCLGHVDCAHALAPLPVALTLGVGHLQVDCIAPFVLGRGGNAVTVSNRLFAELCEQAPGRALADPVSAGAALAAVVRQRAAPLTLGMVFPFSNHNFDLRYWLAGAGIHPDREVRLVAIPPPLMVESLQAGLVDGFCVGEPWNSLAVAQGLGSIVVTQSQLFPRAVEKVLALRASFAQQRPSTLAKLLRALDAAAAWADDAGNHAELASCLARPAYLDLPQDLLAAALGGRLGLGALAAPHDPEFLYFHRHGANAPHGSDGVWAYAQMVRWGQLAPSRAAEAAAAHVFGADLYRQSVPEAGDATPRLPPFDRLAFSGADVPRYLAQFELKTAFARAHAL